ncbi:PREDICTED: uncharacterized protein LOC105154826 isoform X1 [Acromyrmex echinatior]|uniref:uncharacterized protein LOC105154826 isoform X1 n=2 Tax=Acromyrmex echinatior TaxID=103372 RepID=UPI0005810C87|nr:PREDICTED: uncharacterized protein LOC105154826 isoform X1 [Acromyrmex echinatior]XP_011068869.1 PREDICTED: uncharacterized protein LOC105154826 isoform X1 [Acromyrmex echinatior]XP_011068871.1 PREDICTED: uncharacterized protein LOC105154826 isoform X1 [Acromyrmex echinatior]
MINTTQEDDEGMIKDPVTDPFSISDYEKERSDMFADSCPMSRKRRRIETSQFQIKWQKSECHFKKDKHKLNIEEKCLLQKLNNFEEWEEMPLINIKKLLELHIKLIHKVPPQHKIELSGSHAPTKEEKILFQKHGPIRKGSYRPIEDKIIRKNWNTFCELHDWDPENPKPFLYWRHNGRYYINDIEERQRFVQFLANGLPWRTLYSVYSRFKVLYCNKITYARYTAKEDKKILTYIGSEYLDKRYTKYSELAKLLRRTSRSIFKRYQYLKNQTLDKSETESLADVKWTLPLIKKFIKTLLSVTISKDIKELKDATLPKSIWQKMEENLNINENVLRTFWQHQLHLQLFSTSSIYLNDIKIQLIEYMYTKGISNTREIIWPNVAQHFDGATAVFLCKVFFYLVQECKTDTDNFADVVEYLYHTKIPEIQNAHTDKFLSRIIYENGKISLLNTETNNNTNSTDS